MIGSFGVVFPRVCDNLEPLMTALDPNRLAEREAFFDSCFVIVTSNERSCRLLRSLFGNIAQYLVESIKIMDLVMSDCETSAVCAVIFHDLATALGN